MDEFVKIFVVNAPFAAIFLLLLMRLYNDTNAEREKRFIKLEDIDAKLDDIKERLVRLEVSVYGERFPTQAKRKNHPPTTPSTSNDM